MKERVLVYQGYRNDHFCFEDENGRTIKFMKSRAEIIHDFKLFEKVNINKSFLVRFFILSSEFIDQFIISDLSENK